MPTTRIYNVECECGEETMVAITHWAATRYEPPDGETSPEECPNCGRSFVDGEDTNGQTWSEVEPDPDIYEDDRYEERWEPRW